MVTVHLVLCLKFCRLPVFQIRRIFKIIFGMLLHLCLLTASKSYVHKCYNLQFKFSFASGSTSALKIYSIIVPAPTGMRSKCRHHTCRWGGKEGHAGGLQREQVGRFFIIQFKFLRICVSSYNLSCHCPCPFSKMARFPLSHTKPIRPLSHNDPLPSPPPSCNCSLP
jgi:hypothetical protein